jgi:DNA-binding transcriptional LysR family regulator
MELRQLKTFVTVAQLLSFNRAAEILNYAQSTVSSQIKLLEEEFGQPLFDRLGKRILLTEAGHLLLQYSQKMLSIEKETLSKVSGWEEPHGTISIRMPQSILTYYLPSILSKFHVSFPKVGLDISTCAYDVILNELRTGIIDVAFLLANSIPFSELKTECLRIEPLVVVSSSNHPLAGQNNMHIRDLADQSIFLPKHDCSYKMIFEHILTEENIGPVTFMELNSLEAIKQCILKGLGVAMIPLMAVKNEIEKNQMTILSWPEETLETAILMIWHKDKWLSPTVLSFMNMVKEVIQYNRV